jgi:hypothetical protein
MCMDTKALQGDASHVMAADAIGRQDSIISTSCPIDM